MDYLGVSMRHITLGADPVASDHQRDGRDPAESPPKILYPGLEEP